jgi:hypothetical protein
MAIASIGPVYRLLLADGNGQLFAELHTGTARLFVYEFNPGGFQRFWIPATLSAWPYDFAVGLSSTDGATR